MTTGDSWVVLLSRVQFWFPTIRPSYRMLDFAPRPCEANEHGVFCVCFSFPRKLVVLNMVPTSFLHNYVFLYFCSGLSGRRVSTFIFQDSFKLWNCQPLREYDPPLFLENQPCTAVAYQEHHECNKDQRRFVQCCFAKWESGGDMDPSLNKTVVYNKQGNVRTVR